MTRERTAGEVLQERLASQVAELHRRDAEVRDGVEDGVHQLRVTCRRLRGALASFRPVVDREVTDPLRDELRWLARTLGGGRDAEVAHARLRALVGERPPAEVVGPVRRRVDRTCRERGREAAAHTTRVLASARYRRLVARLDRFVAEPPFTGRAAEPADVVLRPRVQRDLARLAVRVEAAHAASGREQDHAWHQVRKGAKRLRYAVETIERDGGARVAELRAAVKDVTSTLGERQDTVVTRRDLRRLARDAAAAGENAFTYGVLHEAEHATAARLLEVVEEDWRRLEAASRRWRRSW